MSKPAEKTQPTANPGASDNPGDGQDPSQRSDPRPAFDEAAFRKGFGKGAEKGRQEGASAILESLGLPSDPGEAKAYLESLQPTQSEPQPDQQQRADPRVQELAKAAKKYETELAEMRKRSEILERQADEARREKIRSNAVKLGVGHDQTDALLALYGDQITMSENGDLEVVSEVAGERVAGVTSLDDFIGEILKARPWLAAPRSSGGSGFEAKSPSDPDRPANPLFDSRPLGERIRGRE